MAGLLSDILGLIDRAKQSTKANVGLLMDNPQEYGRQINESARDINRQDTLAVQGQNAMLSGMQPSPEQMAAMAAMRQRAENLAMGFAGTVGSSPRSLPLGDFGEITRFSKSLPKGDLYRELGTNNLLNMASGSSPMGAPITMFAEIPEMALGQGANKGILFKVESGGLTGKPYMGKPGLDQAFLQRAGEFEIKEQPNKILNAVREVWVSPEAYKGISKSEKIRLDRMLSSFENSGVKVNKVDTLPGR